VAVCVDALRYYLLRDIPFGEDGDFSRAGLVGRFNADLANDYGNLLNRTLALVVRDFGGRVPERRADEGGDAALRETALEAAGAVEACVDRLDLRAALEAVWKVLAAANRYLDGEAPWAALRRGRAGRAGAVLRNTLEAVRIATILLSPMLPAAAARVWDQLGIGDPLSAQRLDDARRWSGLRDGAPVKPGAPVFPRIDATTAASVRPAAAANVGRPPSSPRGAAQNGDQGGGPMEEITIEEFKRLDIRVGEITGAERVQGTDKLVRLTVDIGDEVRTLVAGIATHYQPADLVGRRIVVLANLKPRQVRGVESRGMMLAATWGDEVAILTVDRAAPKGSKIS
jgi:methionyl-tRNA synthetase